MTHDNDSSTADAIVNGGDTNRLSFGQRVLSALGLSKRQVAFLRALADNPRKTIVGFVLAWFVARIIGVAAWFLNWMFWFADQSANAVLAVLGAARYVLAGGLGGITGVVLMMHTTLVEAVTGLGLAAFPAAVAAFGIEVFVTLVLIDAFIRIVGVELLSSVPILGSVTSALGVVYDIVKTNIIRAIRVIFG